MSFLFAERQCLVRESLRQDGEALTQEESAALLTLLYQPTEEFVQCALGI